ncbi:MULTISPECIES: hypothetical protein [Leptospira]|uniref:Toxin-antitoxin system, antitoxin component, PHD domain protein n=1 Tax=Leptospira interrogans str. UI 12758 TaxID=1049938 RepID=A0A0E2DAU6_LEPIR|nr:MULTISPECIES: hypothetical protein [Leptospira]EKR57027.1 toxin-antitoxin system, antitoxin component, PHD domain protein [Leptospira interrogans str. UI 12758]EMN52932.1 toxin-antitoxin system, antitoxin component, PHD domain protein [Leptospira interrogans serovar Autumnalis str. LP101]EMN79368.1 toxin-antitoxin system, antitoxin component, PHD domain protein [Leptospira interrogans serovar Grippotyphosa str. UI 12764]
MKSIHPQYITDDKGKKLSVVLSIKEYQNLLKELENIRHNIKEKEPTKKEILDGIKQGLKEVELHRQGKLKLKSAKELLDEL